MTTSSILHSKHLLIGELLKRATHYDPNREAFIYGDTRLTYREFDERATHFAGWLQCQGIRRDDKVGFIMKNSLAFAEVFFGISLSGGVGVPINFRLATEEFKYIINNSDSKVLIIDEEYVDAILSIRDAIPQVENVIVVGEDVKTSGWKCYESIFETEYPYTPCEGLSDEDPAMIVYTSGTTGRPKGAVLTHKNLVLNRVIVLWEINTPKNIRQLIVPPLFHVAAMGYLLRNCLAIGTSIIHREFEPEKILQTIEREKIESMFLVPAMWNFLLNVPTIAQYDLTSMKECNSGGAITPLELKKQILKTFENAKYTESFGQTEMSPVTTSLNGEAVFSKTDSVGKPILGVEIRIVDDEMNDVPVGEVGEIVYRGPNVMKEYYNNPEATAEAFRGGWFHSGDLVKMDEEGYIYVVDRKKDMIISGGENIYPKEIEEVLFTHPAILEAAVIGIPDVNWGERVKAYVVLKAGEQLSEQEVIDYCMSKLASYKKPREVEFINELPRNTAGKVLKTALREPYLKEKANVIGG